MRSLDVGRPTVLEGIEAYLSGDFSEFADQGSELYERLEEGDRIVDLFAIAEKAGQGPALGSTDVQGRYDDRDHKEDKAVLEIPSPRTVVHFDLDDYDRRRVRIEDYENLTWKELIQNFNNLRPTLRTQSWGSVSEYEVSSNETPQSVEDELEFNLAQTPDHEAPNAKEGPAFIADYDGGRLEYARTGPKVYATSFTEQLEGVLETLVNLSHSNSEASTVSPKLAD